MSMYMPTTLDATKYLQDNGVWFICGKASNAGGVATSALEMSPVKDGTICPVFCGDAHNTFAFDQLLNSLVWLAPTAADMCFVFPCPVR